MRNLSVCNRVALRNIVLLCMHTVGMLARMQTFPEWLRARLDERQWTSGDLGRASGVSNSIIWRWLSDRPNRPTPANLEKIAPVLGVAYEELLRLCGYLPGEAVMSPSEDVDWLRLKARWPELSEELRRAVLRLTSARSVVEAAV